MKKILFSFLMFFLQKTASASTLLLEKNLASLIQTHVPQANIGILLLEATSGNILYEKNADHYFTPASTLKLLPAASALLTLGQDYQFETKAHWQDNDLHLSFNGDPSFSSHDLIQLIATIKSKGISSIAGDIVVHDHTFEAPFYGLGWTADALPWYYAAPVTSIILNENKIKMSLQSNPNSGEKTTILLGADEPNKITIYNQTISVAPETAETECQFQANMTEDNTLYLEGCFPYQKDQRLLQFAVRNPFLVLKQNLLAALKEQGVSLQGDIKKVTKPFSASLHPFAVHYSAPLSDLLRPILTDSHNLYADSITKMLGFAFFKKGNFQSGTRAIKEILKEKLEVNLDESTLFDGSGLSRYNLMTPKQMGSLLQAVWKNPTLKNTFLDTLAVAGKTGTLSARFKMLKKDRLIHAKTGTLSGVSALAGYIESLGHQPIIFVIFINNVTQPFNSIRQFEEAVLNEVILEKLPLTLLP